jgi:hypothetical protein
VNGALIADGITSSGINIGTLRSGEEATVKFSARVDANAVPSWGHVVVVNTIQVQATGVAHFSSQLRVTLGSNLALGSIGQIQTGPADSILLALLVSALATGLYAAYTRTNIFSRRFALATIRRKTENAEGPNVLK